MASNLKFAATLKNAQQDAITTQVGASCLIDLYDGAQPDTPDVAVSTQNKLATLTGNATFAPGASAGVLTLNAITGGVGLAAAGAGTTATWFRMKTSGGVAKVDGTVGISGCDLNLNNTNIAESQAVGVTGWTFTNGQ